MRRTPNDQRSRIYCVLALAIAAVLFVALYQGGRWLEKKNEKPEIRGDYRQRYAYDTLLEYDSATYRLCKLKESIKSV